MRRRRNADRSGKGLRHFSMKVCKKVEEKGKTTYNEVADELVEEVRVGQANDGDDIALILIFCFGRRLRDSRWTHRIMIKKIFGVVFTTR